MPLISVAVAWNDMPIKLVNLLFLLINSQIALPCSCFTTFKKSSHWFLQSSQDQWGYFYKIKPVCKNLMAHISGRLSMFMGIRNDTFMTVLSFNGYVSCNFNTASRACCLHSPLTFLFRTADLSRSLVAAPMSIKSFSKYIVFASTFLEASYFLQFAFCFYFFVHHKWFHWMICLEYHQTWLEDTCNKCKNKTGSKHERLRYDNVETMAASPWVKLTFLLSNCI